MALPLQQSGDRVLQLLQTGWKALLDPILDRAQNSSLILKEISLANGTTVVRHGLDKKLSGWKVVRQRAAASIYDAQDGNPNPATTLILISSAAVVVDLEVF